MSFFDIIRHTMTPDQASRLPLSLRVAWAAFCVDQVLKLVSPGFAMRFYQGQAVELAWNFACGSLQDLEERSRVGNALRTLAEAEIPEQEGYAFEFVAPGLMLLNEIESPSGRHCAAAVEYAASLFSSRQLWIQGVSSDPAIPPSYEDQLAVPFFQLSRSAFHRAQTHVGSVTREIFTGIELDLHLDPLPVHVLQTVRRRPPEAERAFFAGSASSAQG